MAFVVVVLISVAAFAFLGGILYATAAEQSGKSRGKVSNNTRVIYPHKTNLAFEGAEIEGEFRNLSDFYFHHRNQDKFDSLVKSRKNFHQQMLRDVVMSK